MRVVAVGDIGIHGSIARAAAASPEKLMAPTRSLFDGADLMIGNLEIPIAGEPGTERPVATGAAPPEAAELLRRWGFTHLSLANNHVMDHGREGLMRTLERLRESGSLPLGAGADEAEALRPVLVDSSPPLALLAYSMPCRANATERAAGSARFRLEEARRAVEEARRGGRLPIVSLHLGRMYLRRPSPAHRKAVQILLEAGAALVLCHHSHVPAGWIESERGVAMLGLGDFLFDPYQGEIRTVVGRRSRRIGLALIADLEPGGTIQARREILFLPAGEGPRPHPAGGRVRGILRNWDRELRLPDRGYSLCYYLLEFPRLLAYIGHAAAIHACRGNWRKVHDYSLGLLVRRARRQARAPSRPDSGRSPDRSPGPRPS